MIEQMLAATVRSMSSLEVASAGQRTRNEDGGGKHSCAEAELYVVVRVSQRT
jgi:hypothetical protein